MTRRRFSPRGVRLVAAVGLAAAAALVLVLDRGETGEDFLTFTGDLEVGAVVAAADLGTTTAVLPRAQAERLVPAAEAGSVEGMRILSPHQSGDLVARSSLGVQSTATGYTISVPADTFAGPLVPGDVMDVLSSGRATGVEVVAWAVEVTHVEVRSSAAGEDERLIVGVDAPLDVILALENAAASGGLRLLRTEGGGG